MVDQSLVVGKQGASNTLVQSLVDMGAPLLAAYWEWREDNGQWVFFLVPRSEQDERKLIADASGLLIEPPYRSIFSLSDVLVDARQIKRAKAIGSYIRGPNAIGRRFDTTFTGGEYFEAIIPVYIAQELMRASAASR